MSDNQVKNHEPLCLKFYSRLSPWQPPKPSYFSLEIPYFDKLKNSDLAVAKSISWKAKPCIPKCWVIYFEMSWILLPQTSNANKKVLKLFLYCYCDNQQNRKINILYAFCWSWFLLIKVGGYYHLYCHILHMLMFSL